MMCAKYQQAFKQMNKNSKMAAEIKMQCLQER